MRKFLKLLAVLVVLVLVAAACGDNSDEESNADPGSADGDDAADGDSASDGDDPSAESDGPGEVTTVRMVLWPGPEGDAMQQVVDAYNDGLGQNQGVQIEMILLSRDDTFARELTEIAAESSAVDLYFTASYNVGQFANGLAPISDLGIDESVYFPAALESLQVGGEQYALPLDVSNHFLYYRTDLIDELLSNANWQAAYRDIAADAIGEARDPKHPDEWDVQDYLAAAAFFSESSNPDSPTQYGTHLQAKANPFNVLVWNDILWGVGGAWTDAEGTTSLLESPEAVRAVNVFRSIFDNDWTAPSASQAEYGETNAAFQNGQVAFIHQWSAAFATLDDPEQSPEVAGNVGIAPVPGSPQSTHVHALAVSLNAHAENSAAARTWLQYLATPEAMDAYAKAGGIPSMPKVLLDNADLNPAFKAIGDHVQQFGYSPYIFDQTFPTMEDLGSTLSGAWVGINSVEEALADASERLQERLDAQG